MEEHLYHLEEMSRRIQDHSLKTKLSKCQFVLAIVRLLGHVADAERIRVNVSKIFAIKNFPTPTTTTEFCFFLELAQYYCRFIEEFAEIWSVIYTSTFRKKPLICTDEVKKAFQSLQRKLTTPTVLAFIDFDHPFIFETAHSCLSLGAVLAQQKEDREVHRMQLASRTMSSSEKNYATSEREALAVLFALSESSIYSLSSILFTAFKDHQALRYTFQNETVCGRLALWLDVLAKTRFED